MKVLHVVYGFAPDPAGGTEVYVEALCRELQRLGVEVVVAAPAAAETREDQRGLRVCRFGTGRAVTLEQLYGDGDPVAAASFQRLLDDERPDVVHQHAVSPACSVRLMRAARARRCPVVFTYHTPAASCSRGTLLRWGREVCDGQISSAPCVDCTLHGLGAGRVTRWMAGAVPAAAGTWLGRAGLSGGPWTALRMSALMCTHHARVGEMFALPDRIVALTPWVAAMLAANGVEPDRIVHVPHGTAAVRRRPAERRVGPCRFVHLGRFDPVKGTHVLLTALRDMGDAPCELDIFGIAQDASGRTVRQELAAEAASDQRVRFVEPVDPSDVVDRLAAYDVLVVPSQWLETGPLVVLEAFAAGVPVVASALGGLRALVRDGVDGVLVEPFHDVSRWAEALRRLALDRPLRDRLRANVASPRTMRTVAGEMHAVYSDLLQSAGEHRSERWRRASS